VNIWPPPLAERLHLRPSERVKGGGAHGDADDLDAGRKEEIIGRSVGHCVWKGESLKPLKEALHTVGDSREA